MQTLHEHNASPENESKTPTVSDTSFSVQVGVNVGLLALDLQVKRFSTFVAGNIGVPLLTDGAIVAFAAGAGYTVALSKPDESMWFMDFFGIVNPARTDFGSHAYERYWGVGMGAGVGFRYLHHSGFTLGLKLPLMGVFVNNQGHDDPSFLLGRFYLANAIALPVVSVGYRF